ncbi:MAG TPA: SIR2 family protein, partial [Candidatus Kapabacteria bacterium]|nr:SIR2 family protein [Candidatus Kapabacteria bacterium]
MEYSEWDDDKFDTLIYSIRQKNCILMLGPDVETELAVEKTKVLTEILANLLAEKIDPGIKTQINSDDLAQVSQNYCAEKGRSDLEAKVLNFYNQRKTMTNTLHQNLAELGFYLIITTTPGNMTYEALTRKKTPIKDYYNFRGNKPENVKMGTVESPLMYYLYGSVDNAKSLLLTENDLLDFLASLISKKPPLPDNILSEFQDENKSFLFLGFGFRHWYLRILLHALQGGHKRESLSFALEQFTPENAAEIDRNAIFFKRGDYKIHLFKEELNRFVERLRNKYEGSDQACTSVMAPNAPEVFISYANDDQAYAMSLYRKL